MDEILDAGSAPQSFNLGLTPLHPAYKKVIRVHTAITTGVLTIPAIITDVALAFSGNVQTPGMIMVPACVLALYVTISLPHRKYRRWGYTMATEHMRVLRGFLFRTDTIVPFNRIQHIDVGQGPVERLFGVSTLVVHTAGTHNSTVSLPGLDLATAEAMRDTMREHIKAEMI